MVSTHRLVLAPCRECRRARDPDQSPRGARVTPGKPGRSGQVGLARTGSPPRLAGTGHAGREPSNGIDRVSLERMSVAARPLLQFDNSYVRELEGLYVPWTAEPAPAPRLLTL